MYTRLSKLLGIRTPIILPPMAGVSGGALAAQVTLAGGFGFVAAGYTGLQTLPPQLSLARNLLSVPEKSKSRLPVGVGFVAWEATSKKNVSTATSRWPVLDLALDAQVSAIWFSFGDAKQLIEHARSKSPETKIFVQVHSVDDAVVAARDWKADAIVVQGIESGGHGPKLGTGMGTFSLVPEVVDTLNNLSINIPVLAAGGVATGRQLAAALALGASGACVGTRMIATNESLYTQQQKELIVSATDGGKTTTRTRVFDVLRGTDDWPMEYDGRALRNKTTEDEPIPDPAYVESMKAVYMKAAQEKDVTRIVTYAGQSVGLIKHILPAAQVVKEITDEALATISSLHTLPKL